MAQWYCVVGGQRFGPVEESVLRDWAAQGRLAPDDMVWTEGMADWVPLHTTLPQACVAAAPAAAAATGPGAIAPATLSYARHIAYVPGGTGGQSSLDDITRRARQDLRGRWGVPIALCLLSWLISIVAGQLPFVGFIAQLIIAGPLTLGVAIYFLTFCRGGQAELGMMFAGFRNFGNALAAYLLMGIFIFLWSLLLIVPGIIAALAYSQTFYLLADNPNMGALEAIRRSKELMNGHKWRLFCLNLLFFLWGLACLLTLFIGFLWLMPYIGASYARFHDDLHPPLEMAQPLCPAGQPAAATQ